MRALSKQRLSKMHAMLDKQLEKEDDNMSNHSVVEERKKEKSSFNHLRYTSNIDSEQRSPQQLRPKNQSLQRQSLFRKSLQKSQKQKQNIFKSKKIYTNLSSSQSGESQKQTKNSLKGSRKNQINELEKKLLDLEKKMENIGLSSDEEHSSLQKDSLPLQLKTNDKMKKGNDKGMRIPGLGRQESKNSFKEQKRVVNALNLKQNNFQTSIHDNQPSSTRNQGTARFSGSNRIQQTKKRQKSDFRSNLPLSHRNNTKQQQSESNSDDEFSAKYQKFVKVSKGSQKALKPTEQNQIKLSSQQQDSSDQIHNKLIHNKSITQQIQRLSIMKKESFSIASNKPAQNKQQNKINLKESKQKTIKTKIHTLQNLPDRKLTVEHQVLEPKYSLERRNKSKSQSKKSIVIPKRNLSKQKVLSKKKSQADLKQKSASKNKIERNFTNLDNSFRSQNSAKSKKSINSMRSVGSNRSVNRKDQNIKQLESLEEKKYLKKIMNLQKQLEHFKRLSKKYESELSNYKLMEIQYRKLENQFKKSEQIRIEQKKIIQNFRNKTLNA